LDINIQNKIRSKWKVIYLYPIAIILLFEEWGWTYLAKFVERITKLSILEKNENPTCQSSIKGRFIGF
jgi:hypothetical protein